MYAKILQTPEYRDVKLKTASGLLPGLLGPEAEPLGLRFAGPKVRRFEGGWSGNSPSSGLTRALRLPRSPPAVSPAAAAIHLAYRSTIAPLAGTVAGKDHRSAAASIGLAAALVLLVYHGWSAGRAANLQGKTLLAATSVAAALAMVMIVLKDLVLIHLR